MHPHLHEHERFILSISTSTSTSTNAKNKPLVFMEVGMHSSTQCLQAARVGLQAHCVEPSPSSFKRIDSRIRNSAKEVRRNVKFYQLAASTQTGLDLEFMSGGGTGDHVGGGGYDVWTMTKREASASVSTSKLRKAETTIVKSVALDDIISNKILPTINYGSASTSASATKMSKAVSIPLSQKIDNIFFLKVDTQGHEPSVFAGLQESIREHKIDLILTEYWPKGIDFMNDSMGPETECTKPVEILQPLLDAGYTLYTLPPCYHPKAPKDASLARLRRMIDGKEIMPLSTLREHCMWYYDLERQYREGGDGKLSTGGDEIYQMGYWTDVLAVKPGFKFTATPVTRTGKIIAERFS
mmetsp:Transcript_15028/g.22533  ORF Transcript_15028/g.22533 Transcript_15028/m.22533 type:complete len:355 (+) Transcript_15028:1023-2087(+)